MIGASIWNILFWIFVGIAIGGLISWLIGSSTRSATTERLGLGDFEGRTVTVREERTLPGDQLETIEGIGPKINDLLHKNGVFRFAQLAAMSPVDITKILKTGGSDFDIARPYTWPFQARLLENGWISEFIKVKEELRAGRHRLHGIEGISDITAERLHGVGYGSLPALEEAEASDVVAKLAVAHESVSEGEVTSWIDQARRLLWGDHSLLAAAFGLAPEVLEVRKGATFTDQRDVEGTIVDASPLAALATATATATARPSLLPVWLGLGGAALMALLSALGMGGRDDGEVATADTASVAAAAPAVMSAELDTDALFETNSAVLTDAGKAEIDSKIIEPALGQNVSRVRIVGHADVRGDDASNLELSRERAAAVGTYMRERAMQDGITWDAGAVEVFGAGEQYPNPAANTAEDCAAFLDSDPTSEEASACFAPDRRVNVDIITESN